MDISVVNTRYLNRHYNNKISLKISAQTDILTQGKCGNEAGREKDKQETANLFAREYVCKLAKKGGW